jgi:hypothetical protein
MRADKDFVGDFDQQIGVNISPHRAFLFDADSGSRVDA